MLTEIKEFLAANPVVLYAIIAVAALIIVLAIVGIAKSGKKNKMEKSQDDAVTENASDAGVTDIQTEPEAVAEPEASAEPEAAAEVTAEVTAEETPEDEETVSDAEPVEEVKQEDKPLQLGEGDKNTESEQQGDVQAEESISEEPAEETVKPEEPAGQADKPEEPAAKPAQKTKPAAKKTAAKAEPEKDEDTRQVAGKYKIEKSVDIYQFILYANNGQLLYESREYATLASCKSGIETFKKNVADCTYRIAQDKNGAWKFIFRKGNSIYIGESYSTKTAAENNAESVKRFSQISEIAID